MRVRTKIAWEALAQVLSISGGLAAHVYFHRLDVTLVVVLALECFLHMMLFIILYGSALDKLDEWARSEADRLKDWKSIRDDVRQLRANAIPIQHAFNGDREWPFDELLSNIVREFKTSARLISEGNYDVAMDVIQDVSFKVCDKMEQGAFCTALERNLEIFFDEEGKGKELCHEQYEAAERLARSAGKSTGFTRLFIFDDLEKIKQRHLEFMQDNHAHAIEVLVAQKDAIKDVFRHHGFQDRMDFGKWQSNLLMEITGSGLNRRLIISRRAEDIKKVDELIREVKSSAKSYSSFLEDFKAPMNVHIWSRKPEPALDLDVPDGPHQSDCDNMFNVAAQILSESRREINRIAVYGLTQKLIDTAAASAKVVPPLETTVVSVKAAQLTEATAAPAKLTKPIDIIDARQYVPKIHSAQLNYVSDNWMKWLPTEYKYDLVVADDVLCNLTFWQTPLFFQQVGKTLSVGGLFIFRTTARFFPGMSNPSWDEVLSELLKFDQAGTPLSIDMLTPGIICEAAWPTLHTLRFYDEASRSLSLKKWNDAVSDEASISSVDLKNRLKFQRELTLTSMKYEELQEMSHPHFNLVQEEMQAYSRWENDPALSGHPNAKRIGQRFHEYYRIVVLQKKG